MAVEISSDASLNIFRRLEAATSRLEDMVPHMSEPGVTNGISSNDKGSSSGGGAQQPEGTRAPPPPAAVTLPASIDDFDALINGEVTTFFAMSEEIGGLLAEQVTRLSVRILYRIQADFSPHPVCCPSSSVRCGEEISHRDYQSEAARYPIPVV